jgi:hypothetical protein
MSRRLCELTFGQLFETRQSPTDPSDKGTFQGSSAKAASPTLPNGASKIGLVCKPFTLDQDDRAGLTRRPTLLAWQFVHSLQFH